MYEAISQLSTPIDKFSQNYHTAIMSNLKYFDYDGYGKFARENYGYSQAVRVGDRIEISGQGMRKRPLLLRSHTASVATTNVHQVHGTPTRLLQSFLQI